MKLTLTMIRGPQLGHFVTLLPGHELRVGRADSSDLPVMDPIMSRTHFRIACQQDAWRIWDLSSRNGTKVNDQPVTTGALNDGDVVTAGSTSFRVTLTNMRGDEMDEGHAAHTLRPPHQNGKRSAGQRT